MMIKFLLLTVLCAVVLADTGMDKADDSKMSLFGGSLMEVGESKERLARDAKKKNERRRSRKEKKNKKVKNSSKGSKKRNKNSKGKKGNKRNKNKKSLKKRNKKNRSSKKKSKNRKNGTKVRKQNRNEDSCSISSDCIAKAELYMKTIKDKIGNYEKQKKRIERQSLIAEKKLKKKDDFAAVLNTLVTASGGNKTALVCDGSTSSEGANQLNELSETLDGCSTSIENSCKTSFPMMDTQTATGCMDKMESFSTKVAECIAKTGTDACTCWTDSALAQMQEEIKSCSLSSEAANTASGIRACTKAFSDCRQVEDLVGRYIFGCKEGTTKLKKSLEQLTKNKNVIEEVQQKIKAISTRKATSRAEECSSVISISNLLLTVVSSNPSDSNIQAFGLQILQIVTVVTCTEEEKAIISALDAEFSAAVSIITITIIQIQLSISDVTGTTVTASEILSSTNDGTTSSGESSNESGSTSSGGSSMMVGSGDSSTMDGSASSGDSSMMSGSISSEDSSSMDGSTSSGESSIMSGSASSGDSSMFGSTSSGDSSTMSGLMSSGESSMMMGSSSSEDSSSMDTSSSSSNSLMASSGSTPATMDGSGSTFEGSINNSMASESGGFGNSSMFSTPEHFMGNSEFFNMSSMVDNMTFSGSPMLNLTSPLPSIPPVITLFPLFNMSSNNMTSFNMSANNSTMNSTNIGF